MTPEAISADYRVQINPNCSCMFTSIIKWGFQEVGAHFLLKVLS
jgi:hypothetical protein